MEYGKLILWEPLKENPFDRFYHPMSLERFRWDNGDFVLTFLSNSDSKEAKLYDFTYIKNEKHFYAIRTFRFLEEFTRGDIEVLIGNFFNERKAKGLPNLTYEHTFWKVDNSSYLSWYKSIDPSIGDNLKLEHHLYITGDYFIDVLAEQLPVITISTYNEENGII